ncbi:MAG TPA: alpha-glucan family phosphorylase [Gammaproteobacteria bacterium]|nr:alpha-glucan family phosphorylase [Gammaproteobacteria bacterium]
MKSLYDMLRPDLPDELNNLYTLALDLRWSWSHVADALWRRIDEPLWRQTHNPWLILQTVSGQHLKQLAADPDFIALLQDLRNEQSTAQSAPGWFQQNETDAPLTRVAYFSMEFGLSEALPIYSGGLGVLAGDHLKTAGELGVPLVGIGLLYQQGYFRQGLDADGNQLAFFPYNDPSQLPLRPVRDTGGEWLHVQVTLPGRSLRLRLWQVQVGRVVLYLLDSNALFNTPADRGITSELYGGGSEMRLQQEIILGIGGYRVLQALAIKPEVCHLNEGHAAFVVLERARQFMLDQRVSFEVALTATRAGNLFTTHTPVEAGFDRFAPALLKQYMADYAQDLGIPSEQLLALGQSPSDGKQEAFSMALLAMRGSGAINGVSRLHGEVSRKIFQPHFPRWPEVEVPIAHVTNGVHVPSWDSLGADSLWTSSCGKERWREDLQNIETHIKDISDDELWAMRTQNRLHLIEWLREHHCYQQSLRGQRISATRTEALLDPNSLTLGFARRFATYKRPNLLLHDPDRFARLLNRSDQPVQMVLAGKAHPQDHAGQAMIRAWIEFIDRYRLQERVIFIIDYDLLTAEQLVQGVDLWINTPRRPWEACGTSGMKILVNGGLNLSELDGWWAEAWQPEVGWALGDGQEHDSDPAWDYKEADDLYQLLEEDIIPAFYQRDHQGIPTRWVERMRSSMAVLTPFFSTNRMVREYTERYYLKMAKAYRQRSANKAARAWQIEQWNEQINQHWGNIRLGNLETESADNRHAFTIQVYLDDLDAGMVQVELYADPPDLHGELSEDQAEPERHIMEKMDHLSGAVHGYRYMTVIANQRPVSDYTIRIIPCYPGVQVPLENQHILWQR